MMNCHIKRHIDDAIDAMIGGNWDASLYEPDDLLMVVRRHEVIMGDRTYPIISVDDCADFLEECAF